MIITHHPIKATIHLPSRTLQPTN